MSVVFLQQSEELLTQTSAYSLFSRMEAVCCLFAMLPCCRAPHVPKCISASEYITRPTSVTKGLSRGPARPYLGPSHLSHPSESLANASCLRGNRDRHFVPTDLWILGPIARIPVTETVHAAGRTALSLIDHSSHRPNISVIPQKRKDTWSSRSHPAPSATLCFSEARLLNYHRALVAFNDKQAL